MLQKLNEYTLYESASVVSLNDDNWFRENTIAHEFNFLARQRTTTTEFVLFDKKNHQSSVGVAVSTQNFRDIEGEAEIERAHGALIALGGTPPPLDEVLDRKSVRLTAKANL